jgi:hypothetical protein
MAAAWLVTKWLHEGRFTWPPTCDALSLEIGAVGVIGDHLPANFISSVLP